MAVQKTDPDGGVPPKQADAALFADNFEKGFLATARFLRSKGIRTDLAEELSQAAWVRGWQRRHQLRDPSALGSWVNSIAFNLLRRHLRQVSNAGQELFDSEAAQVDSLLHLDIFTIMQSCGELDRQVLRMFYFEGMTSREIGSETGEKALTIRVRLHRIRKRLLRALAIPTDAISPTGASRSIRRSKHC